MGCSDKASHVIFCCLNTGIPGQTSQEMFLQLNVSNLHKCLSFLNKYWISIFYTTSSALMSSGLTYSNPSNSVWSILPANVKVSQIYQTTLLNLTNDAGIIWSQLYRLISKLRRKVCQVSLTFQPWPVGWRNLLLLKQLPFNGLEKKNKL